MLLSRYCCLIKYYAPAAISACLLHFAACAGSEESVTEASQSVELASEIERAWQLRDSRFNTLRMVMREEVTETAEGGKFRQLIRHRADARAKLGNDPQTTEAATEKRKYLAYFTVMTREKVRNEYWDCRTETEAQLACDNCKPGVGSSSVGCFNGSRHYSLNPSKTDGNSTFPGLSIKEGNGERDSAQQQFLNLVFMGVSGDSAKLFPIRHSTFKRSVDDSGMRPVVIATHKMIELHLDPANEYVPVCIKYLGGLELPPLVQFDCEYGSKPAETGVPMEWMCSWFLPNGEVARSDHVVVHDVSVNGAGIEEALFEIPMTDGMYVTDHCDGKIREAVYWHGKLFRADPFAPYIVGLNTAKSSSVRSGSPLAFRLLFGVGLPVIITFVIMRRRRG